MHKAIGAVVRWARLVKQEARLTCGDTSGKRQAVRARSTMGKRHAWYGLVGEGYATAAAFEVLRSCDKNRRRCVTSSRGSRGDPGFHIPKKCILKTLAGISDIVLFRDHRNSHQTAVPHHEESRIFHDGRSPSRWLSIGNRRYLHGSARTQQKQSSPQCSQIIPDYG